MNAHERHADAPVAAVAWRCELDRTLHPMSEDSHLVYIEEVAQQWSHIGAVKTRGRFVRRMVVCRPCLRTITDLKGAADAKGPTAQ